MSLSPLTPDSSTPLVYKWVEYLESRTYRTEKAYSAFLRGMWSCGSTLASCRPNPTLVP